MKNLISALTLIFVFTQARAGSQLAYSASGSGSTTSHDLNASYSLLSGLNPEADVIAWIHSFSYAYNREQTRLNLNSNLTDFEISSTSHGFEYGVSFRESLQLNLGYSRRVFSDQQALQNTASLGLAYSFLSWQIGISGAKSQTYQNKEVILLNRDYRDEIKFNRDMTSYFVAFDPMDNLNVFLSYTYYTYDENLENMYTLLTTVAFLNRNTSSMASEISAQINKSYDFGINYTWNDQWLTNLAYTLSDESLSPQSRTETVSVGAEYETFYNDLDLRLLGSLSSSKTEGASERQGSLSVGAALSF